MPITDLDGLEVQPGPYPFTPYEPNPHDIYLMFIQSIRDADRAEGELLLLRFLERMQLEWGVFRERILDLTRLYDLETTPAEALAHVKSIVGLSPELDYLTGDLTDAELRRLISIAVRMWLTRGTEAGLEETLRAVTADEVRIDTWFDWRTLLEEWEVGWSDVPGVDLWLTDAPGMTTSQRPDAVAWDGTAIHLNLASFAMNLELHGGAPADLRTVRILCVPSRVTEEAVCTLDVYGNFGAVVTGDMGQVGTPSTNVNDYRAGHDPAEYVSDVRVNDNGGVNRELVENLCRALRPALERYFVRYVTFLDTFRRTPDWVTVSGTVGYDADAGTVTLGDLAAESVARTDKVGDTSWTGYLARAHFQMSEQTAALWGEFRFYVTDADNFYALRLTPSGTIGAEFTVERVLAGVRVTLDTAVLPEWFPAVDYALHADVEAVTGGNLIQAFLDGDLLLTVLDASHVAGRVELACETGQTLTATYIEVAEKPIDTVRVGPAMSTGQGG